MRTKFANIGLSRRRVRAGFIVAVMFLFPFGKAFPLLAAKAQCQPEWESGFDTQGMNGSVGALTVFDDGTGPALYAGGFYTTAGDALANSIAKWNGSSWSPLGSGLGHHVFALTGFDDGTGPALYAGGFFTTAGGGSANRIAKWNPGAPGAWSALGSGMIGGVYGNGSVNALAVFDDGTGPALYAGGDFTTSGGVAANYIAKWNPGAPGAWSALGSGVSRPFAATDPGVYSLTVFNDGTGPALYVGGVFDNAGGVPAYCIAKWNGSTWSALGSGMNGRVTALTVFDDGTGPALYAGGVFTYAGEVIANRIAKWNPGAPGTWSPLGSGMFTPVLALTVFNDGSGPALYAGGEFDYAGGVPANYIAKWNGSTWSALGSGMNGGVSALTVFDDGAGPALYVGGLFDIAGSVPSSGIAKWSPICFFTRFLLAPVEATGTPGQTAIRVTMIDLQNPNPPNLPQYPPPDFSGFKSGTCTAVGEANACARWVGMPGTFLESQDNPTGPSFRAARLQCTPFYHDFAGEGPLRVTGAEIVPSSAYDVESFAASCQGSESTCTAVSAPRRMTTGRYGDVAAPFQDPSQPLSQPNAIDIVQIVNKLKGLIGAPSKAIAQLQPNLPELYTDINALDIVAVVNAVKQFAYPFSGPCPCPPAVTCGSTACATPTVCITAFGAGAMCVRTCSGGDNAGDPCINDSHCPGGTCGSGFCRDACGRCSP